MAAPAIAVWAGLAHAGTSTLTFQPTATSVSDSYLREDNTGEQNGTKPDLRIRSSLDQHDRNLVVSIPFSGLAGRTVLRAWLELQQTAAGNATPVDARMYPLTESWNESTVTWATRDKVVLAQPWSTPGGTRSAFWSDRAMISSTTTGSAVQWQVGPLVQAWNSGALANNGFLIEPVRSGPGREVVFASSDNGTAALRPKLIVQATDEPPALARGTAEIQPRSVREGSRNVPLTAWLDVDAQGATNSGNATGFDALFITHGGALVVDGVDRFVVGGASILPSLVTWSDDGTTVTFRFPRVQVLGQVQLEFRVDVLSSPVASGLDLPMGVDDTTTPGAWSQSLWPGNGDRLAGNGDDWILNIVSTPPVTIDLTPNTASMVNRTCLDLTLSGRDALGNVFPVVPDSVRVLPPAAGTMSGLTFCAAAAGGVKLVACYGTLRDTSSVTVQPERLTQIQSLVLRNDAGSAVSALAPGDTMFLDAAWSDGDGAKDVRELAFDLRHALAAGAPGSAAFGATFRWTRSAQPAWTLEQPAGTSWALLPSLCSIDTTTNTTGPVTARLAFVVGRVARASASGEWTAGVRALSITPADTASLELASLNVPARMSIQTPDVLAAFGAAPPGATSLPLGIPLDARLHFTVEANTAFRAEAMASNLLGILDTLLVTSPSHPLRAASSAEAGSAAPVDTSWSAWASWPAPEDEAAIAVPLYLWLDHPAGLLPQDYVGALSYRLAAAATPDVTPSRALPLRASVVIAGLASHVVLSEVTPHAVVAGARAQAITVHLRPLLQATDTGVDAIRVSIPAGFGAPTVTQVRVAGSAVGFQDTSTPGLADVTLDTRVTASQPIDVTLTLDAPAAIDETGSPFVVLYDDRSTAISAQTATEGDANGIADGNNTLVRVTPGPLARLVIAPANAGMFRDSSFAFTAVGQDSLGHVVPASLAWSVQGGIGTITSGGVFTATTPGTGRVFVRDGSLADSAQVSVYPPRVLALLAVGGPSVVHQGDAAVTLQVRLQNRAPGAVVLDTLALHFGRARSDDADDDFTIATAPGKISLGPGEIRSLDFTIDVALDALAAPLGVVATASGVEEESGIRLRDVSPDTTLAWSVLPADLEITSTQGTAAVRPGSKGIELLALRVRNRYPDPRFLQGLTLANRTVGPGDRDQLDAELGDVTLYRDDGDGSFETDQDTLLLRTVALDGAVNFAPLYAAVPAGGDGLFFVGATPSLASRDGDVLDLELVGPAEAAFKPSGLFRNAWPVGAPGGRAIDGMVAAQVRVFPVGPVSLHPGTADQLALDLVLPGNGYSADLLTALGLVNLGTASAGDIQQLRAWSDDGDGVFSPARDALLGSFAPVGGGRWQLSGLALGVPAAGRRIFASVSLPASAQANTTIQLAVPTGDDPGIRMASGNSGPLDAAVANPAPLAVSGLDRVALVALPLPGGTALRGARLVPLAAFALTNNYDAVRTLNSLLFDDVTAGPGTLPQRDAEVSQLVLRLEGDGDGVLGDATSDPVLATSFFQDGVAAFTGLHLTLEPFIGRQLYVTADLAAEAARDGDVIGGLVRASSSVDFAEAVTVTAAWPLDSGARRTVDGFTAAQVSGRVAPAATIGPGDGPLLALDLVLPANGYTPDVLRSLRVRNLGTASATDLSAVQLWRDGGNGAFDPGGDDVLLAGLTASGSEWASPLLSEPVSGNGARVFVSVTAAAAAAESSTVRLSVPVDGVEMASEDDGPLDGALENPASILISSSPLLATVGVPVACTVGQPVAVNMAVRNVSGETVRGVVPASWEVQGSAQYTLVSGPSPASFDLAPGAVGMFTWQLRSDGAGDLRVLGAAVGTGDPSNLARRAPRATSSLLRVYLAANALDLTPIQTMPVRVNRGQANVVPFSLTLAHPGEESTSDVIVDRLRIRLVDDAGSPVVPASLLDRVVVNEGTNVYATRTGLETAGSTIDLPFSTPATVTGTQPATLSLRLDVSATTTVPAFRVVIDDSSAILATDATNGAPVTVHVLGGAFPVRSDLAGVVTEATALNVTAAAQDTARVSRGASAVPLATLRFENPGVSGISSSVRVTSLRLALLGPAGAILPDPGRYVTAVRLMSGTRVLAARPVASTDPESLSVVFDPRLDLPANAPLEVTLVADVAAAAPFGAFGAKLLGPATVEAQDVNTGAAVAVSFQPDPLRGGLVRVESAADTLRVFALGTLPNAVLIGERAVPVMSMRLRHPGAPGAARLRVDSIRFQCLDDLRRPLVPGTFLDRLELRVQGVTIAERTDLPTSGNHVDLPLTGVFLEPGDTLRVDVTLDADAAAPAGFLELVAPSDGFLAFDANSGNAAALVAEPGMVLPPASGLGRLVSPSRELAVGLVSTMPAALAPDGRPVSAGRLTLRNADPGGAGPIQLDRLAVQARNGVRAALPLGAVAARIEAWHAGALWAQSAALSPDSVTATLVAAERLSIDPGDTTSLELRLITRTGDLSATAGLGVDQAGVGVVQPASALLAINVRPEPGLTFPLWTEAGSLSPAGLEGSYSNFPNPFAAGRQSTTFVYNLASPGRVTLRILTLRGEPVATLLEDAPRTGGLQQSDTWTGRNGAGNVVYNGVYLAELAVRFDDGASTRVMRKVAVVR